jgi:hypothetical protein
MEAVMITLSLGALVALVTVVAMVATCGGMLIAGLCVIAGRADERAAEAFERERVNLAAGKAEARDCRFLGNSGIGIDFDARGVQADGQNRVL